MYKGMSLDLMQEQYVLQQHQGLWKNGHFYEQGFILHWMNIA